MSYHIYLSYSAVDRPFVSRLYNLLDSEFPAGVWMDSVYLSMTDDWVTACRSAYSESSSIVGIASLNSLDLRRVQREWEEASNLFVVSLLSPTMYNTQSSAQFTAKNILFAEHDNYIQILIDSVKQSA